MRRRLVALSVVPLLLFGAACGDNTGEAAPEPTESATVDTGEPVEGVDVSGPFGEEPEVTVDSPLEVGETTSQVLEVGDGAPASRDEGVLTHFSVYNGTSGKKIGATYEQDPLDATLTDGQLFTSFISSLEGVPSGSRVVIASTPDQAYGPQGAPQLDLKADDPVVFVVDLLSTHPEEVLDAPEGQANEDLAEDLPDVEEADNGDVTGLSFDNAAAKPSDKLQVITLIEGDGPPADDASFVTFDYLGQIYGTDNVFDESYSTQPRTFAIGVNKLIPAWDQALPGVKRGSRIMLIVPPEAGYGAQGNPGANIKGTDTLVFVLDVLGVD